MNIRMYPDYMIHLSLWINVLIVFLIWKLMRNKTYRKTTRIDGKVVIITGANAGVGKETAIDLARRGGKVYIACRDIKRGEDALKEIKKRSGSNNVHFLQIDLTSVASIRNFCKKFRKLEKHLHILVNNAGAMACPKFLDLRGFKLHIGKHHMGNFFLTIQLLDVLKRSSPSRIVNVSSPAQRIVAVSRLGAFFGKFYFRHSLFTSSKLTNNLFTLELSKRLQGTGVTANSAHMALARVGFTEEIDFLSQVVLEPIIVFNFNTETLAAQTQIRLAVDPELENVTGKSFFDSKENKTLGLAIDHEMAAWFWKVCDEFVKCSCLLNEPLTGVYTPAV